MKMAERPSRQALLWVMRPTHFLMNASPSAYSVAWAGEVGEEA
jgi:hypothetical protein